MVDLSPSPLLLTDLSLQGVQPEPENRLADLDETQSVGSGVQREPASASGEVASNDSSNTISTIPGSSPGGKGNLASFFSSMLIQTSFKTPAA